MHLLALLDEYALFELIRVDYILPGLIQFLAQFWVQVPHMAVAQILFVIVHPQSEVRGLRLVAEEIGKATRQYARQAGQIRIVVHLGAKGATLIEPIHAL